MNEEFLSQVAEILEVPQIGWTDDFRAVPGWCSLNAFALVVMFAQRYGRKVELRELQPLKTVADLAALVGVSS